MAGVRKSVADGKKAERIILGIDPGTLLMGYGILRVRGRKAEMVAMGVVDMRKVGDLYLRYGKIFERVTSLIDEFLPDEMAIEGQFYSKNVQSMLKLGRAQGVAIAAAIGRDVPICEYEPRKIKVAVTGNGAASKEQVAAMLQRLLLISDEDMKVQMDATDALAAAYCHFHQLTTPAAGPHFSSWKDFALKNKERLAGGK